MNRTLLVIGALAAAAVLFVAVNIIGAATLRVGRLDLTEGRLYTLSAGSKAIAAKVDEPIKVTLYYSDKALTDPSYKSFSHRVLEVLQELRSASGNRIDVETVDPEPFSDAESDAADAGLVPMRTGRNAPQTYFGIVGKNSTDQQEVLPLLDPAKEDLLEYDLTRMVYLLSNPKKNTVALMAQLPVEGMKDYPLMRGQNVPAWKVVDSLRDYFDVKTVTPDKPEIPADAKVLVLIHPKTLSDAAQYAVDQFVMRGGRLLVFVDPYCLSDLPPGIDEMKAMTLPRNSHLEKLFDAWGIEMVAGKFVADRSKAFALPLSGAGSEVVPHLIYLGLDKSCFSQTDAVTADLDRMIVAVPGALQTKAGATIRFDPIIHTSTDSQLLDVSLAQYPFDAKKVLAGFTPSGQQYTIAARLSGILHSAFPAGDPTKPAAEPGKEQTPPSTHLAQSKDDAQVIVVADCDLLADRFWAQEQTVQGIRLGVIKVSDNADFVVAAVDNLCGSNDLIGLRARGRSMRPFDRIEQMQKEADQKFAAEEEKLRKKGQEFATQISDIVNKAPPGVKIMISPEDQTRLTQLRKDSAKINDELRKIQYQRGKDVERIGTMLKFVNIGLIPLVVGVAAVGLGIYRANRRRTWSHSVGARN
jgi:ABC-type uncharacterized transport system involved in gliding motility auxiliary subunit